jgi:hypothetical protein
MTEKPEDQINLVWQRGDVLRRCKVWRRVGSYSRSDDVSFLNFRLAGEERERFLDQVVRETSWSLTGGERKVSTGGWVKAPIGSYRPASLPESKAFPGFDDPRPGSHIPEAVEVWERRKAEHERDRNAAIGAFCTEARQRFGRLIDQFEEQYDSYEKIVAPLFDLPQLFIAV